MDFQQLLEAAIMHYNRERHLLPMYLHLIVSALFPIWAGAHASLSRPSSAGKPAKKGKAKAHDDDDRDEEDDVVQRMEGMSPQDAVIYPVVAAITLGGLYFLIKRYGAEMINLIFGWYFAVAGVFSVAKLVSDAATLGFGFVFPSYFGWGGRLYKVDGSKRKAVAQGQKVEFKDAATPVSMDEPASMLPAFFWAARAAIKQRYIAHIRAATLDEKTNFTLIHLLATIAGIAASAYANLIAKPWYLTNLQGFAVCYTAFQMLSPTSFTTGSLLLAGLFCYDVWAVFFTPLMVTVAKNLDQPIKLVFPRPEAHATQIPFKTPKRQFSMLGLGDIVLPGIMIALALRFDLYLYYLAKQRKVPKNAADSKGNGKQEALIENASYVPRGSYGDRFWTARLPASLRPEQLNTSFPKPYFYASMVGYIIGMFTTLIVMGVFQHAQPALLYLVPGVLVSLWGTALVRTEVMAMWGFSEAVDAEQIDEGDEKKTTDVKEEDVWNLEKWQTWVDMSNAFLRFVGLREKAPAEKIGKDGVTDENDPAAKEKINDAKKSLKADAEDDGVVFSFSVSRHKPPSASKREGSAGEPLDSVAAESSSEKAARSGSGSDDAVLVDSHNI